MLVVVQPDGTTVEPPDPPTGPLPDPPPPGHRLTGTCDPLTHYARDVTIATWLTADADARTDTDAADNADPADTPGEAAWESG